MGDRHACKLHITVFYSNGKEKILGSDWKTLEGLLTEENYNQAMKKGILLSTMIPIEEKKQMLKVVVFDEGKSSLGSKLISLDKKRR